MSHSSSTIQELIGELAKVESASSECCNREASGPVLLKNVALGH